ncbi:acyltransferase [Nesterenkonia sp. HG001]|uniref:acyltransferase n=1 Tax=Nesterenkonia sp. HG001 TaxID=2983207 RepID=UPI002ACC1383|nr:acyltransferase [Nesterenkonia sp. HG001]
MSQSGPRPSHNVDYSPWKAGAELSFEQRIAQEEHLRLLEEAGARFGDSCFVSEMACVDVDSLDMGDHSYIAAGAYVTGDVTFGRHCSVNVYTVVRGDVRAGDGVRIGAHTSILGFNHSMSDPDIEIFRQPLTSQGITIGDDVWIGSNAVLLDGITVGSKSVIGAGSVVTKDVPSGAVVGGNPARVIRYRTRPGSLAHGTSLASRLERFADDARRSARPLLESHWSPELGLFTSHPSGTPTTRAQGDAIEIADLLLGDAPPQMPREELVELLRSLQDSSTGMICALSADGTPVAPPDEGADAQTAYHILSTGYALDLLGSAFAHPITMVSGQGSADVVNSLERLPWTSEVWGAGDRTDILATAIHWNSTLSPHTSEGQIETVIGWLMRHVDPVTGMWGSPRAGDGLLQIVNGYYRTTRGSFAQFGVPVPHPERVIDTVLRHAEDPRWFRPDRRTACNVLDVAHPLWLASQYTSHRESDITELAQTWLPETLGQWVEGDGSSQASGASGFSFRAPYARTVGTQDTSVSLQGTEMWLAIVWFLADLAGVSASLDYRPRGVHRPEPAWQPHLSQQVR